MNKNKIIICLFMILICILTVSAVSAADNVHTNSNQSHFQSADNDVLSVESQDVLSDPPTGTFTDLNGVINNPSLGDNPTIYLDRNYSYDDSTDGNYKGGIFFTKGMTIDGQGHTIDGSNLARIFGVGTAKDGEGKITHPGITGSVTLKNIIFINAYGNDGDHKSSFGSIEITGNALVDNCKFINNTANCAAAIAWGYSSNAKITNCYFENNRVNENINNGGGAIRLRANMAGATIENSVFNYNYATTYGGAIHFGSNANTDNNMINNCTFINNTAKAGAGAVFFQSKNGVVSKSRFINNSAPKGGAVYWDGFSGEVLNSNFTGNNATEGGAIYVTGASSNIISSRFIDNTAEHGGAIRWSNSVDGKIMHSTFIGNNATVNAGAISWLSSTRGIIDNTTFTNNHAGDRGGAIRWSGENGTITKSNFTDNTATSYGGAISWAEIATNGKILNSHFTGNNATNGKGGALYWDNSDGGLINNTTFNNNYAIDGSGMYIDGTFCSITYSNFTNNNADYGASLYLNVGAYINRCLFDSETASHDGGAIYLNVISSSTSSQLGQYASILGIFNSTMSNCHADNDGGAGYIKADMGIVRNTTFINNTAGGNGGAGYVYGNNGKLLNSTFIGNNATNGGAVYWYGINGTAWDIKAYNNTAIGGNGGAIYLSKPSTISLTEGYSLVNKSSFANNSAVYGGSIFCGGLFTNILNSTFAHDSATDGAGIYLNVGAYIYQCSLFDENALNDGGGIYLKADNDDIDPAMLAKLADRIGVVHTNITKCSAGNNGGAGYVAGEHGVVRFVRMVNNTAGNDGGAGYVVGDYGKLYNSTFINNTASDDGGALYWMSSHGSIFNITAVGNIAGVTGKPSAKGGSIWSYR